MPGTLRHMTRSSQRVGGQEQMFTLVRVNADGDRETVEAAKTMWELVNRYEQMQAAGWHFQTLHQITNRDGFVVATLNPVGREHQYDDAETSERDSQGMQRLQAELDALIDEFARLQVAHEQNPLDRTLRRMAAAADLAVWNFWDSHSSLNAGIDEEQFRARLNDVIYVARKMTAIGQRDDDRCATCNGRGGINIGHHLVRTICPSCHGTGRKGELPTIEMRAEDWEGSLDMEGLESQDFLPPVMQRQTITKRSGGSVDSPAGSILRDEV